ncbi:MAG: hypothetical protein AB2A00_05150 [Myxococcota bacterium]
MKRPRGFILMIASVTLATVAVLVGVTASRMATDAESRRIEKQRRQALWLARSAVYGACGKNGKVVALGELWVVECRQRSNERVASASHGHLTATVEASLTPNGSFASWQETIEVPEPR